MHCLERVGDEGVLIALAGKSNNPEVYVSFYFIFFISLLYHFENKFWD